MRLKHLVPPLVAVAPVALAVACYGPTEVTLEVTTDLSCEVTTAPGEPLRTAFYKGPPFGANEEALTESCTLRPGADAFVGSLVLVPSGDSNGRASVKVVLTHGPFQPSDCEARPQDCIVATRSFSFIEHLSRKLPIRMLKECLGVVCPDGTTCAADGTCVSDEVLPDGTSAADTTSPDGGPPIADAGPDANANVDAAPPVKCASDRSGVIATTDQMPGPLHAAHGDAFYFLEGRDLKRLSPGGSPSPVMTLPGTDSTLIAVAAVGPEWVALYRDAPASMLAGKVASAAGTKDLAALGATSVAFHGTTAYVGHASTVEEVPLGKGDITQFYDGGASRIAVDAMAVYLSTTTGIDIVSRDDGKPIGHFELVPPGGKDGVVFATDGTTVYAAGSGKLNAKKASIEALKFDNTSASLAETGSAVVSVAADAEYVYWAESLPLAAGDVQGSKIYRRARNGAGTASTEVVFPLGKEDVSAIDHVAVDADCVYFWLQPGNTKKAVLRALPKPPKPSP